MKKLALTLLLVCAVGMLATFATTRPALRAQKNLQAEPQALGPLRVSQANPRYFENPNGQIVYLTGSHTWSSMQDVGPNYPPPAWDYGRYLNFLQQYNHNFFRLWIWEQAQHSEMGPEWFEPTIYRRTGPGNARDGRLKFDLNQFNPAFFTRLRDRVSQARERGIYVAIVLFDGWSVDPQKTQNVWEGHPMHKDNNMNNINGDPNGDGRGIETHELEVAAITNLQKAYIREVIDTVNEFDNVLYEISNESHPDSQAWQYELINYINSYQASKPRQHVVGMTTEYPNGSNDELFNSPAEWISLFGTAGDLSNPPLADGRKVILADSDHLCGVCTDVNNGWAWRSFTRGENPIFMDVYEKSGYIIPGDFYNVDFTPVRRAMGDTRRYAERMNLKKMTPRQSSFCSTGFCLANTDSADAELLVYAPNGGSFSVNLSGISGQLRVEWFNPATRQTSTGSAVNAGGSRNFQAPFGGEAVLYLSKNTNPATPTPTATRRPNPSVTPTVPKPSPRRLEMNYTSGAPGSVFVVTASNFPPNQKLWVLVTGVFLSQNLTTNAQGTVRFAIQTSAQAKPGVYIVGVDPAPQLQAESAATLATQMAFELTKSGPNAVVRTMPANPPSVQFSLAASVQPSRFAALRAHLPMVMRR